MAIKLDWSNIGKGLSAVAEAKRERDYQKALEEQKAQWATQRERAGLTPEERTGEARFYSLDRQPVTEDMVGPQQLPSITGQGLAPESYYVLPGEETQYATRAAAMAARGKAPTAWEMSQTKADIAEEMGLYDRAKDLRSASVQSMQAAAAELELESKQRKAQLVDAFYTGGGINGVIDQINQFTGDNLEAVYDDESGEYEIFNTVTEKGKAKRKSTGLKFGSADEAFEYALALTSPETLGPYLQSQREARIKAQTAQRAKDEAYADRLLQRITKLEAKAPYELNEEDRNTLNNLRDEYFALEQRLTGPGAGGAGLRGRIAEERARRTQAAPPVAGVQVGQPRVEAPSGPSGPYKPPITYQGLARDIEEKRIPPTPEAIIAAMDKLQPFVESGVEGAEDLMYELERYEVRFNQKANGGLVRRFNNGGMAMKDKAYDENMRKRMSERNTQRVKDINTEVRAEKAAKAERMGALQKAGEYFSEARPSYSMADDANLVYTPTVDFDLRYRPPEYLRSGGLVMKDYRKGGAVKGPGTETSDSIPARLSDGEYVVNAESMKIAGVPELLEAINKMGLQKRRAKK